MDGSSTFLVWASFHMGFEKPCLALEETGPASKDGQPTVMVRGYIPACGGGGGGGTYTTPRPALY